MPPDSSGFIYGDMKTCLEFVDSENIYEMASQDSKYAASVGTRFSSISKGKETWSRDKISHMALPEHEMTSNIAEKFREIEINNPATAAIVDVKDPIDAQFSASHNDANALAKRLDDLGVYSEHRLNVKLDRQIYTISCAKEYELPSDIDSDAD